MTTLFISDLHLDEARPQILAQFEALLAGKARDARALYILGDLVEAWIGDDDDSALANRVTRALKEFSESGVPLYVMRGNRDFLFGARFEERSGCTLLPDSSVITLNDELVLLMHGDLLCTDDTVYQAWRAQAHSDAWQREFQSLPMAERRCFAAKARQASSEHTGASSETIMDVNPDAVRKAMLENGVRRLIHGHTHRPAVHDFELEGQPAQRIVLGDWYEQGSVLTVTDGDYKLESMSA